MKEYPPYQIMHIQLNEQQLRPQPLGNHTGNYIVFWWKNIALGHLYLDPGTRLTEEEFYAKLIDTIQPAIQYYTKEGPEGDGRWQQLLRTGAFNQLVMLMERVFSSWTSEEIPEKVPVSVVICTRNRASDLHKCLDLLTKLRCHPEEIIVVDNAPTDESTLDVVKLFADVTYVKEPRAGLDIARNTGAVSAKGQIIAFCDDDVVVHPLWVYRVWQSFQNTSAVAMTGLVLAAELQTEAQMIFEKHWSFNRGYVDKTYDTDYFNIHLSKGPPVWEIGAGANMAFRKSIFDEVGYFDELLDVGAAGCSGDSEMWYRILLKGHTILYNPRAIAFHRHRQELTALHKQLFSYMRGFAAAALIQQDQNERAGYRRRLFLHMPHYYGRLLYKGFPHYTFRCKTLGSEIRGILSGMLFYLANRNRRPVLNLQSNDKTA
jgi:glycosyltransferase involved in cell wall biosynthesis